MQHYQVPQFIAIEDRIIGPLTLKQFLYLLGAAAIGLLGWSFLHPALFLVFAVPPAGLLVAMAFVRVSGRPLPTVFFSAVNYYLKPRLYLWRKIEERKKPPAAKSEEPLLAGIPKLSESKLDDLAWSLDIKEKIGERE